MVILLLCWVFPEDLSGATVEFPQVWRTTEDQSLEGNSMVLAASQEVGVKFVFVSEPPSDPVFLGQNVRGRLYAINADNQAIAVHFGDLTRVVKIPSNEIIGLQLYKFPNWVAPKTPVDSECYIIGLKPGTFSAGEEVGTSSDPVHMALNALLARNNPPLAVADHGTATLSNCGGVAVNPAGNVLANDSDPDVRSEMDLSVDPPVLV